MYRSPVYLDYHNYYRFGPQLGDNVLSSSSTVNVFARLCLSVILTPTSHDVSNTDQQNLMLMECYKLSYQILGLWQALLEEVLRLFKNSNAGNASLFRPRIIRSHLCICQLVHPSNLLATNCHYVKCLVELLNHPIISQKLWKNRLKLKECLQDVKVCVIHQSMLSWWTRKQSLSLGLFPPTTGMDVLMLASILIYFVQCWSDSTVGIRKELELAVGKFVWYDRTYIIINFNYCLSLFFLIINFCSGQTVPRFSSLLP